MKGINDNVRKELFTDRNERIIGFALITLLLSVFFSFAGADGVYVWPVPSVSQTSLSRGFGMSDYDNKFHEGLDIVGGLGTPIVAARTGTIVRVLHAGQNIPEYKDGGNAVVIRHDDGMYTHYCHMNELEVTDSDVGSTVTAGEPIGYMGETGGADGVHLHFAIADNDTGGGGRINNNTNVIDYISASEYFSDSLRMTVRPHGLEVNLYWTITPDAVRYQILLEKLDGSYSNVFNNAKGANYIHFALSQGRWKATVSSIDADGMAEDVSAEFELGNMYLRANSYSTLVDVSWNDLHVDSYYAYIVKKSDHSVVYSDPLGNITAATFSLADGEYIIYITASSKGTNIKTESVEVTVDSALVVTAVTSGVFVDVTWTNYGADSYWAYVVDEATRQEVYSKPAGSGTSAFFAFAENDYIIYITATKNGTNIKTGAATFSVRKAAANVSKSQVTLGEKLKISSNVESYDTAVLRIYREGSLFWEGAVNEYETAFSATGNYNAVFRYTKGTNSFDSSSISWTVVEGPTISVDHGATIGTDATATIQLPAGTRSVSVDFRRLTSTGEYIVLATKFARVSTNSFTYTIPGFYMDQPGAYIFRAFAYPDEDPDAGYSSAEATFNLVSTQLPAAPTVIISSTEFTYVKGQPNWITFTVPEAEAIAYTHWITSYYTGGGLTDGDGWIEPVTQSGTSIRSHVWYIGRFNYKIWAKFNGVWSAYSQTEIISHPQENILMLPEGLKRIDSEAFAGLENVNVIRIPASVETIADDAFDGTDCILMIPYGNAMNGWLEDFCYEHGVMLMYE